MTLIGKATVVTGAGQGIGQAIAKEMARLGSSVIVNDINSDKAEATAAEIRSAGGRARSDFSDISTIAGAEAVVNSAIENFGSIDVLVNNAGILRDRMSFNLSEADWDTVINVCLKGTFACSQAASRWMRKAQKGRIINVTSRTGLRGNVGQANYAAAKAGVLGLTRTMSLELKRYGVTVNAISPRAETDMVASIPDEVKAAKDAQWKGSAIRRRGSPEDIAPVVAFIASDATEAMTGQIIGIGGDKLSLWSHPDEVAEAFKVGGWSFEDLQELFFSSVGFKLQTLDKRD